MTLYTQQELDQIYQALNPEQQQVLNRFTSTRKRLNWLLTCSKLKGSILTDEELENPELAKEKLLEWQLVEYIDHLKVSKEHCCECGRPLRYEYIVKHLSTGQLCHYSRYHLEDHLGMTFESIQAIQKGMAIIDEERQDILIRWKKGYQPMKVPAGVDIPKDMVEQLRVGLPLTHEQEQRLSIEINKAQQAVKKVSVRAKREAPDLSELVFKLQTEMIQACEILQLIEFIETQPKQLKLRRIQTTDLMKYVMRALKRVKVKEVEDALLQLKSVLDAKF